MSWFRRGLQEAFPPPPLEDYPEAMRGRIEEMRRVAWRRRMWSRAFGGCFYATVFSALTAIAWVIAMATDRGVPTLTTVELTTPAVAPGTDLAMRVTPHRLRICEAKVLFRAYDRVGNVINQSETEWSYPFGPLGVDEPFIRPIRISRDAVLSALRRDGGAIPDARMRIERRFYCNPVQKLLKWPIVEVTGDMPFAIKDPGR